MPTPPKVPPTTNVTRTKLQIGSRKTPGQIIKRGLERPRKAGKRAGK